MSDTTAAKMYRESARGHAEAAARKAAEAEKLLAKAGGYGKLAVEHERKAQEAEAKPETVSVTLGGYHDPNLPLGAKSYPVPPGGPNLDDVDADARPAPIIWPKVVKPTLAPSLTVKEMEALWPNTPFAHLAPIFTDTDYAGATREEWQAVIAEANTKSLHYDLASFNCSEFGALARGLIPAVSHLNGIGWVIDPSSEHSYSACLVFDADGKNPQLVPMEPQLDEFTTEGQGHYQGQKGYVIF